MTAQKILYIEPFSGVSGDMLAAVLLSLVKEKDITFDALKSFSLPFLPPLSISLRSVIKHGIRAEKFCIEFDNHAECKYGRTLEEIISIINAGQNISVEAKDLAIRIFKRLAESESKVHGTDIHKVHFHEIGATDAIVDIVIASIAFCKINPDVVIARSIVLGSGTINSIHGVLPVPAPATVEILKNIPVDYGNINEELTTPTGAAIIAEITNQWNISVSGKIVLCKYGAGTKDLPDRPNVLRASLLEQEVESKPPGTVAVIETNIDDMPGEFLSHIVDGLFEVGILDYAVIPATMKKNRHGFILQIICLPEKINDISEYILKNSTTIGVRYRFEHRMILKRKNIDIDTRYGNVKVKLIFDHDGTLSRFKPAIDDISKIAQQNKLEFSQIYLAILAEISNKLKI